MSIPRFHFRTFYVLAASLLATAAGCAGLSSSTISKVSETIPTSSVTEMFEKEEPIVAPKSLAVVWTNTVIEKETAPTTRGFGGMLTFYDTEQDRPVRVHGDLTIYAYDEHSHTAEDSSPDRKYIFTRDQLDKHYADGTTGPTYHIWVPWDRAGGPRQDVSLILRFDPKDGKPVMSKSTHLVLPGVKDDHNRVLASRTSEITQVSHEVVTQNASPSMKNAESSREVPRMKVATLDLPSRGMTQNAEVATQPPQSSQNNQ